MDFDYVVAPSLILLVAILISWLGIRRIRVLRTKGYRTWRRITERVVISLVVLMAVAAGASTTFNALAIHHYWATNPLPGKFYDVGGYKMHIYCTGQGSPTLVLDAGLGNDWTVWGAVQPQLSKTTRVCSYDRAGFGGSSARPGPRDAEHIAGELHELLTQAGITGPIILMAHSIAGVYIRDYAARYPREIAGLIFVDSSTPLQNERPAFKAIDPGGVRQAAEFLLERASLILGVPRLMGQCSRVPPGVPPVWGGRAGERLAEDLCSLHVAAAEAEMRNFTQSSREAIRAGLFGNLPILIFSHDPDMPLPPQIPAKLGKRLAAAWTQMQNKLKSLSTRSRRIIAKGSGHMIPIERPDLLNKEVPIFVQQVRGTIPQPTDYGSTKTE